MARVVVRLSRLAQVAILIAIVGGAAWAVSETKGVGWLWLPSRVLLLGGFALYVFARWRQTRRG